MDDLKLKLEAMIGKMVLEITKQIEEKAKTHPESAETMVWVRHIAEIEIILQMITQRLNSLNPAPLDKTLH